MAAKGDTNFKPDVKTAKDMDDNQRDAVEQDVDNPKTTTIQPLIIDAYLYRNVRIQLLLPETLIKAMGGASSVKNPGAGDTTLLALPLGYRSGEKVKIEETPEDPTTVVNYQPTPDFIKLQTFGSGGRKIRIRTPKPWAYRTGKVGNFVTWHVPSFVTLKTVEWTLYNMAVSDADRAPYFQTERRTRRYLVNPVDPTTGMVAAKID